MLVTTGTDGTVRVHALSINLRGKRIAGRRGNSSRNARPVSKGSGEEIASPDRIIGGADGEGAAHKASSTEYDRNRKLDEKSEAVARPPPETGMGIGVSIQFRACLGGACSDFGRVPNSDGGASAERVDDDLETSKEREGSPRDGGATKIVTSVTAFYHRA